MLYTRVSQKKSIPLMYSHSALYNGYKTWQSRYGRMELVCQPQYDNIPPIWYDKVKETWYGKVQ